MDKFFVVFGKATLVLLIVIGVAFGAYTLGRTTPKPSIKPGAASTTAAPTPTMDPGLRPESLPEGFVPSKTVEAGLGPESGLSFTKYLLIVPGDWIVDHKTTNEGTWVDTLTLTKGAYQIKIFQAATGGAICLYPSDTPMEGPSSAFNTYVEITTADGEKIRRSTTEKTSGTSKGYTFCMKSSYENFQQPTIFGHMSLKTPLTPEPEILSQIDTMISSIKRIP